MTVVRSAFFRQRTMSFPQTHLSLIQRLAAHGTEEDWGCFLKDYWGPLRRFCLRHGAPNLDDAEDIAQQTFEVLWENRLLDRWVSNRSAKLRALLCSVVRNILSNRHRTAQRRSRLQPAVIEHVDQLSQSSQEDSDSFYAAWVEDLVQQAVRSLAVEYCGKGQADRIRVLYGRLCEGLTIAEAADALDIKKTTVDFYFRHARERLSEKLQGLLRAQIQRYSPPKEAEGEFALEWQQLGEYLTTHGGIEEAVRQAYALINPDQMPDGSRKRMSETATRLTSMRQPPPDASSSS